MKDNQRRSKKDNKTFWYVMLMVWAEFFLILDAGFIGYSMEHGIRYALETWVFWILLIAAVAFRYWAERIKTKN